MSRKFMTRNGTLVTIHGASPSPRLSPVQFGRRSKIFLKNAKQRGRSDKVTLAADLLSRLKNEQVSIPLFDGNYQKPVAETTETPEDVQNVVGWAMAIASQFGITPAEALQQEKIRSNQI